MVQFVLAGGRSLYLATAGAGMFFALVRFLALLNKFKVVSTIHSADVGVLLASAQYPKYATPPTLPTADVGVLLCFLPLPQACTTTRPYVPGLKL